jgi:hypothetical protein
MRDKLPEPKAEEFLGGGKKTVEPRVGKAAG